MEYELDGMKYWEVASISREDLKDLEFTEEEINQLSDEDMQAIAEQFGQQAFRNNAQFWGNLERIAKEHLSKK